jgi:membrane protein DedA with SNARE-associated domain
MHILPSLSQFIVGSITSGALPSLAIILGVIFLEDTTVVIVGMLAADKILTIPHALTSLYAGIILGDIGLYSLGYLASSHPKLARYVDHEFVAPFRSWLETRFVLTVFTARFIPGARLPSIWTTFLFFASYWFGNITAGWMGPVRWGIALAFLLALFLIGRHNVLAYRAKKDALRTAGDTRAESVG